jgi:hypothetical protein
MTPCFNAFLVENSLTTTFTPAEILLASPFSFEKRCDLLRINSGRAFLWLP